MNGNDIIADARLIADMAGSDFCSDKEMSVLSEKFFHNYGVHWTEVLN
jgi:hypothetical protein